MEDISKLPKWARQKIENLERQNKELSAEVKARDENHETNLCIGSFYTHTAMRQPRFLNERETISFRVGDKEWIEVSLDSKEPGKISARSVALGRYAADSCLLTRPAASNKVYLEIG